MPFVQKRRLILRVFGGLGNQQFQYAYAKSLAEKYSRQLVLDTSYFLKCYHPIRSQGYYYPYKLAYFLQSSKKTGFLYQQFIGIINFRPICQRVYQYFQDLIFFRSFLPKLINQNLINEESDIFESNRDIVLCGYFQKGAIFQEYVEKLSNFYKPNFEISTQNKYFADILKSKKTVSMHVRRGDYLKTSFYEQLTLDFYKLSLQKIEENDPIEHILIFSDDIEWTKKSLSFHVPTTFVSTEGPDYEHQYLMSLCNHNIIANSTFSWWAAMMNQNPHKIICAPRKWFTTADTSSIIYQPETWILL